MHKNRLAFANINRKYIAMDKVTVKSDNEHLEIYFSLGRLIFTPVI